MTEKEKLVCDRYSRGREEKNLCVIPRLLGY